MRRIAVLVAVVLVAGLTGATAAPASANAPIVVTTTADVINAGDGVFSLREAVTKANNDTGADTIQLATSATYELTLCGSEDFEASNNDLGDLDVYDLAGITITGARSTIRQTCAVQRNIQSGTSSSGAQPSDFVLVGIVFEGGASMAGSSLLSRGPGELQNVSVKGASAAAGDGQYGAAVAADQNLVVTDSTIADNSNVTGVRAATELSVTDSVVARNGGDDLYAGGVWSAGPVVVVRSQIMDNTANDLLNLGDPRGAGGVGSVTSITMIDSDVGGNQGFAGGVGLAQVYGSPDTIPITITRSRIHDNQGVVGGAANGQLTIDRSTIDSNRAAAGAGLFGGGMITDSTIGGNVAKSVGSFPGGVGGGLFLDHASTLVRSTVSGNAAGSAPGLAISNDGPGVGNPDLYGVVVTQSTVSGNQIDATDTVSTGWPDDAEIVARGTGGSGAAVRSTGSAIGSSGLFACDLEAGSASSSGGYTFWSDSSCGASVASGDVVEGGDPQLGPLQANGGLTPTRLPSPGSPLRDRIPLSDPGCTGNDQRGVARPQGLGCDIGATEVAVPPAGFVGVAPKRILDTRTAPVPSGWPAGSKLSPGGGLNLIVAGANGVPADATSVVLNVTSTEATSALSYVTAWPSGLPQPPTSSLNLQPAGNVANSITVAPGVDGKVSFATNIGATHLIVDVLGYYTATGGDSFTGVTPIRMLDTRYGPVPSPRPVGQKLSGPGSMRLPVAGVNAVPADVTSVVVNITSTQVSSDLAFLTAWPAGQARPTASNLNLQPPYNVSNLAVVQVGTGGAIDLYTNAGSTHLIVDVVGYFRPAVGDRFLPLNPTRVFNSLSGAPLAAGVPRFATVAGVNGIPAGATSVVLNATSVAATSPGGYLVVYGKGAVLSSDDGSNLNYRPPYNAPNQVISRVGQDLSVGLLNGYGTVHIVLDANGYFVASPP